MALRTVPDGSGFDVLERIRERAASPPVLILSMHPADQFARRAMSGGAAGYVTKDAADAELVTAVTRVVSGGTYVGGLAPGAILDARRQPRYERLSNRERQVLLRLAQGKTVGEIAVELGVGPKSISTYRTRLLRKLGLRTNADITRYVTERRPGNAG